ncbi:MAG: lamin tail domain-containing protein [Candidatus Paceibacterota bacterium]
MKPIKIQKIKTKVVNILLILVVLISPSPLFAMKINEIMYDVSGTDSGREWVEVYNNTSSDIDFSNWKLLESSVNHAVKLIFGNAVIPAGGYAIIADNDEKFLIDNPDFSGTLFDSVFSLTNTGEVLVLINSSGQKIHEISYSDTLGAKGDGNSLQFKEEFLISAKPTPGLPNATEASTPEQIESNATTTENTTITNISSHSSVASAVKAKEVTELEISIGRERLSSIKSPIIFEVKTGENKGLHRAKYLWNFGDGNEKRGKKIEHFYKNEGVYNVVLNAVSGIRQAVSRTIVYVAKPKLALNIKENGIEIENQDSNEINIGLWRIKSEDKKADFTFPQDTILSPKAKITFDETLFSDNSEDFFRANQSLNLFFPTGDLATKTSAIILE